MISFTPHSKHCSGGFAEEPQNGIELGAGDVDGCGDVASTLYMYSMYNYDDYPKLRCDFTFISIVAAKCQVT